METIKRILNPVDFYKVIDDISVLFETENDNNPLLKYNIQSIKINFGNNKILNWDFFVWANFNGESYDGVICFLNDKDAFFGEPIFSQYFWLSKNKKIGYKLFSTAIKFAKEKDFKYVKCKTYIDNIQTQKVKSFYKKIGLIKESETYICEL
jgi:hypothetical protein